MVAVEVGAPLPIPLPDTDNELVYTFEPLGVKVTLTVHELPLFTVTPTAQLPPAML